MLTLEQIVAMDEPTSPQPWNKLNKSLKLKRLMEFADRYSEKEKLDSSKKDQLKQMLIVLLFYFPFFCDPTNDKLSGQICHRPQIALSS